MNFGIGNERNSRHAAEVKILTVIVRVLLGVMFVVFGSNVFLHFLPMPPMSGHPADFFSVMSATGYLTWIGAFEMIGGALLLVGRFVPLGLLVIGPIVLNIDVYHLCVDRSGLGMAAIVSALSLFSVWRSRRAFEGLIRPLEASASTL